MTALEKIRVWQVNFAIRRPLPGVPLPLLLVEEIQSHAGYRIGDDEVAIGDSYSSKTMVPSPQGAPVGSVASLQAWCIKNKSGSVCLKKALVCLS